MSDGAGHAWRESHPISEEERPATQRRKVVIPTTYRLGADEIESILRLHLRVPATAGCHFLYENDRVEDHSLFGIELTFDTEM